MEKLIGISIVIIGNEEAYYNHEPGIVESECEEVNWKITDISIFIRYHLIW